MKKYNIFQVFARHPILSIVGGYLLGGYVGMYLRYIDFEGENWGVQMLISTLIGIVVVDLLILRPLCNMRLKSYMKRHNGQTPPPKKHFLLNGLFFLGVGAVRSSNRRSKALEDSMSNAIYNSLRGSSSSSYDEERRAAQREADRRVRERHHALDMQKKAEYDARDLALRGKDKGAYERANDAAYWRNQAKR